MSQRGRVVRAGVYNRFWRSRGGGERHSGMVAHVLAGLGVQVELIGHDDVDLDALAAHLGLDLSGCHLRVVPELAESSLEHLSAEYDLFVNASYMSRMRSHAHRSLYLCYFPTPASHDLSRWRRLASRTAGRLLTDADGMHLSFGSGWFPPEGGRLRSWHWSSGDAELTIPPGPATTLRFDLGRPGQQSTQLEVSVGGQVALHALAGATFTTQRLPLPASTTPRRLRFASATDTPTGADSRKLGVAVSRLRFAGVRDPRYVIAERFPWLTLENIDHSAYLDSYDVILANSHYTSGWIREYWAREAELLYPPIQVERFRPEPVRQGTIVTAGRFFAPKMGHSKRQLEQVQAFTRMVDAGLLYGWTLHVIGGCEPANLGYVDKVRAAGFNHPVELHVNAPRDELERIMSSASIVWSATGLGEDERTAPWASEHFGMTTVEAMAAGCVPVVIDRAGQREIVRHGIDGYRWQSLAELTEHTLRVAMDETTRARLAACSIVRAQQYSDAAFARRLVELIERYDLLG